MAALITSGSDGSTGSATATGETRVICSGTFTGGARVEIELEGDSLPKANVYSFQHSGGCVVAAANNDTITATIYGGDGDTSISVTATAL